MPFALRRLPKSSEIKFADKRLYAQRAGKEEGEAEAGRWLLQ